MDSGMTSTYVAAWFTALPLSDPRCDNDSCVAYQEAHDASQAQISWASQFWYGHYTAWFYAIIIFVFTVVYAFRQFESYGKRSPSPTAPNVLDKATAITRSFTYRRLRGRVADRLSFPSFGVMALLLLCCVGALALAFAQHPYYRMYRGFGSPPLAVRTGLMAFALIPLGIALGGKVNMITWITGIGHEKLNVFHRWTGYIMFVLAWIHTIPFLYQAAAEGFLHEQFYSPGAYEYTGVPPLAMLFGLVALSLYPIRRYLYEAFVHSHVAMAVVYLGLCFWHAGQTLDSWTYLWFTVAIWLFTLSIRWFGKLSLFELSGAWLSESSATITQLDEAMVRLDVPVQGRWRWEPGQHVFLRFVSVRLLDNHPFTIANMPKYNADGTTTLTFFIRPMRGITARIGALAGSKTCLPTSVDGPYGTIIRPRVEVTYNNVVLVAGGGGVSGLLPWLEFLTEKLRDESSVVQSVRLIWAIRDRQSISWIANDLHHFRERAPKGTLHYDIWVTGDGPSQHPPSAKDDELRIVSADINSLSQDSASLLSDAHFSGRPRLTEVMPSVIRAGRNLVLGCGPESLKIDLSNAVASQQRMVSSGQAQEVRLHTETFGW